MRKMIVLIVLAGFLVMAGCGSKEEPAATPAQQAPSAVSVIAKLGQFATDPFAQMSFEFEGNPTPVEIQERMDRVLPMYGLEASKENRSQAGRTLVALRKEHGRSEMKIMDQLLATPANARSSTTRRPVLRLDSSLRDKTGMLDHTLCALSSRLAPKWMQRTTRAKQ